MNLVAENYGASFRSGRYSMSSKMFRNVGVRRKRSLQNSLHFTLTRCQWLAAQCGPQTQSRRVPFSSWRLSV